MFIYIQKYKYLGKGTNTMDIKSKIRKLFVEAGTPDNGDAFQKRLFSVKDKLGEPSLSSSTRASAAANLRLAEKAFKAGNQAEAKKWLDKAEKLLKPTEGSLQKPYNVSDHKPTGSHNVIADRVPHKGSDLGPNVTTAYNRGDSRQTDIGPLFDNMYTNLRSLWGEFDNVKRVLNDIDEKEGTTNLRRFEDDYEKLNNTAANFYEKWRPMKSIKLPEKDAEAFYMRVKGISDEIAKNFGNSFHNIKDAISKGIPLTGEVWQYTPKTALDDLSAISGMAANEVGNDVPIGNDVPVVLDPDDRAFRT